MKKKSSLLRRSYASTVEQFRRSSPVTHRRETNILIDRSEFRSLGFILILLVPLTVTGCWTKSGPEVVVYSALDGVFAEPILNEFANEAKIKVLCNFDSESTKTVGLVNRIIDEQRRPRCDVFWNNEILHSLRLQKLGLLDVYRSPVAAGFPEGYRSSTGHWHGFAARARVLIVNTDAIPNPEDWPKSIIDLADSKWKGKVAIAKPLFGTTASHAAVLFSHWGDKQAKEFFAAVKKNAVVLSGNKQVAVAVGNRRLAFGLTDTDDAIIEKKYEARPIEIIYPDQGEDAMGTLFIPNTLCVIKGGPNPKHAQRLVDYLLSPKVETQLATGRSAQFPVNPSVNVLSDAQPKEPIKWMKVDFNAAADHWDEAREYLLQEFATAN